jgi:hypothetical protein
MDRVYDRLVVEEKLKGGTKYERLAAIAFRELTGHATVHDLRLRGRSGVKHQIDAVVGADRTHILVETKDYDTKIGLPIIRNFWGAVEDIRPDESFVVTTVGFTRPAVQYAEAKGIHLALLRPPEEQDWEGVYRRVQIEITMTGHGLLSVSWHLHPHDAHKMAQEVTRLGLVQTRELELADADGRRRQFFALLDAQLAEDYGSVPFGEEATIGRINVFEEPTWLIAPAVEPLRVGGWRWEAKVASDTITVVVEDGVGGLVAELALRTLDGSVRRIFSNRDIQRWTFDGHTVVPRT